VEGHGSAFGRGQLFGRRSRLRRHLLRMPQEHSHLQVWQFEPDLNSCHNITPADGHPQFEPVRTQMKVVSITYHMQVVNLTQIKIVIMTKHLQVQLK
jgi:hypothetical protein